MRTKMGSRNRLVMYSTIALMMILLCNDVVRAETYNITEILSPFPDLTVFNDLLSRTKLSDLINGRQETVTVLVANNSWMEALTSRAPLPYVQGILMGNVVLDYFDLVKKVPQNGTVSANLFQTTGVAEQGQGFVAVSRSLEGVVTFRANGEPVKNASRVVGQVYARPYKVSVLQVSELIVAPGMLTRSLPPSPAPAPSRSPSPAPGPARDDHAPAPSPGEAGRDQAAPSPGPGADGDGVDDGGSDQDSDSAASHAWAANAGLAAVAYLATVWFM